MRERSRRVELVARALAVSEYGCDLMWEAYAKNARAAIDAMEGMLAGLEGAGRFSEWSTADLSAQCRMQARLNLDPELTAFMVAVADRLATPAKTTSPD